LTPEPEPQVQEPVPQPVSLVAAVPESPMALTGAEEMPYSAASRLGGLRTLMSSLGIRNPHKDVDARNEYSELEPRLERQPERAVFAQPETHAQVVYSGGRTAEVIAAPEIIPPRAAMEQVEREKEVSRPVKSPRVSRWDTPDDVQTLPSLRGQYRKRR
jgi:hypothetical protein